MAETSGKLKMMRKTIGRRKKEKMDMFIKRKTRLLEGGGGWMEML